MVCADWRALGGAVTEIGTSAATQLGIQALGPAHPFNAEQSSSKTIVDFGRLDPAAGSSPLQALYADDELLRFVGGCIGVPQMWVGGGGGGGTGCVGLAELMSG